MGSSRQDRDKKKAKWKDLLISAGILAVGVAAALTYMQYQRKQEIAAQIAARQEQTAVTSAQEEKQYADTIEYNGRTYRRNSYVKAILCMGIDRRHDFEGTNTTGFGGQADALMLIAQDTARNQVKILAIPRDTMTEVTYTDIQGNEIGKNIDHLTMGFSFGDGQKKSCEYMQDAVSTFLFDMKIDHYLAMNMTAISILNDTVGGVTVTVETDGMEKTDPAFVKGATVRLEGSQAEKFVRFRDTKVDFSAMTRMSQQQQFVIQFEKAVAEASKTNSNVVSDMFDAIQEDMYTDMNKAQYLKIALDTMQNQSIVSGDFETIQGESKLGQLHDEFYPDMDQTKQTILDLFYREEQ